MVLGDRYHTGLHTGGNSPASRAPCGLWSSAGACRDLKADPSRRKWCLSSKMQFWGCHPMLAWGNRCQYQGHRHRRGACSHGQLVSICAEPEHVGEEGSQALRRPPTPTLPGVRLRGRGVSRVWHWGFLKDSLVGRPHAATLHRSSCTHWVPSACTGRGSDLLGWVGNCPAPASTVGQRRVWEFQGC